MAANESDSYKCNRCESTMTIVVGATKNLYECAKQECGARAVIVEKGVDGSVFRYNLPPANRFPSTTSKGIPHPKGAASFALRSGRGEEIASMPGGLMRAVATVLSGGDVSAVDIANEIVPDGVEVVTDDAGNVEVTGLDGQVQQSESEARRDHRSDDGKDTQHDQPDRRESDRESAS